MNRPGNAPPWLIGIGCCALLLSSCATSPAPRAHRAASVGPTASASPAPVHTVRPGLLVSTDRPLTRPQMNRLEHVHGVRQLAFIEYGPVRIYDIYLNAAAVDISTYRQFVPDATAHSDAAWAAVASGDALVSHAIVNQYKLPVGGLVPTTQGTLRIAGLATTVPGVDMVINNATGRRLGIPGINATVVAIDTVVPMSRIIHDAQQILGPIARIQQITGPLPAPGTGHPQPALPTITPQPSGAPQPSSPSGPTVMPTEGHP